MSASMESVCVFCFKKNDPLRLFTPSTLEKCKKILEIRKNNILSMNNAKVPVEMSDLQKYHSTCYKRFAALPKWYRSSVLSQPPSHKSSINERNNEIKLRERNSHKVQQTPIQVSYECKYRDVSVGSDDDSQQGNSPNSSVGFQQQQPVQNQANIVFSVPVDGSSAPHQYIQPANTTMPCKSITDTMSSLRCAYDYVSEQQQTINGQQQQSVSNSSVGYIFVPSYVHNPDVNVSALPRAYGDNNGIHSAGIPSQQHNLSTMFIYTPQQGTVLATDKEGSGQLLSSPQHNIILPVSPQSMPPSPVYVNGQQQYIIPIYSNNSAAPPVNFSSPIPGNQQPSTLYVTFPTHQMSNTPPVCFQPIECDGSCMQQSQPTAYLEAPSSQFLEQPIPIYSAPPHVISAQSQQSLVPMAPGQDMYSVVYPAAPVTSQPSMQQATMYENN